MTARTTALRAIDVRPGIAINDLANRVAEELRGAAATADDCQTLLSDVIAFGVTAETTVRMQALDMLTQQLDELSRIFERLAASPVMGEAAHDLLDEVRLIDLKRRLAGESVPAAESGEMELW